MIAQPFYDVEEMAEILHKKPYTIYRDTSRRNRKQDADLPPFIKVGNRILFPVTAFNQWIEERLNGASPVRSSR